VGRVTYVDSIKLLCFSKRVGVLDQSCMIHEAQVCAGKRGVGEGEVGGPGYCRSSDDFIG
jgi:hypothetical protein